MHGSMEGNRQDTPNLLRGFNYDTIYEKRCNMYHQCILTKKCQNYDPNRIQCVSCESRCSEKRDLGGCRPELANGKDYQANMKILEEILQKPYFTSEDNAERHDPILIEERMREYHKNTLELQEFLQGSSVQWEDD